MTHPAPASPNWTATYKGVEIALCGNGKFSAVVNRKYIELASVAAVKKQIDKLAEFQSFKALTIVYGQLKELSIVGTRKVLGRYRKGSFDWVASNGVTYAAVYEDTPAIREALTSAIETRRKNEELISDLNHQTRDAMLAIPKREVQS